MLVVWQTGAAFVRNIQRATRYVVRRRHHGKRYLTRVTSVFRIRGKRRIRPLNPGVQFVSLAAPGVVMAAIGLPRLLWPDGPIDTLHFLVMVVFSFVFALRAYTARAGPRLRAAAVVLCLAYPVLALLAGIGLLG